MADLIFNTPTVGRGEPILGHFAKNEPILGHLQTGRERGMKCVTDRVVCALFFLVS
jgi:hypothetical protein